MVEKVEHETLNGKGSQHHSERQLHSETAHFALTDPDNFKITKLLMVATGETKRLYLSQLLCKMRS